MEIGSNSIYKFSKEEIEDMFIIIWSEFEILFGVSSEIFMLSTQGLKYI